MATETTRRFVRASTAWPKPGEYIQVLYDGEPTARIGCPDCGQSGILDHEIADDGSVTPSIQCASHGCTYHESGCVLVGWVADFGYLVRRERRDGN